VPFLVKLPFQQHGRDVSCDFDVIVLRMLIEELLRGSIPSDQSLDACLRGTRSLSQAMAHPLALQPAGAIAGEPK
jgi:hypothetical protein